MSQRQEKGLNDSERPVDPVVFGVLDLGLWCLGQRQKGW